MIEAIVIVVLAALASLFIVDYRLSDISINMPTVKLPEITVNITGDKYELKVGTAEPHIRQFKPGQTGGGPKEVCTYYLDPKDMDSKQLEIFRNKANLKNMTAKDYQNWLSVQKRQ